MDLDSGKAIAIGCLVGVISSATQSIGLTLQRKSHILEDVRPEHIPRRPPHRRTRWRIGMFLFLLSNILGSSVQITTLPLVILSPLQAVGLVFNSICSSIILHEPFTIHSLVGTILVSIGAFIIALFGVVTEPHHNLNELLILLHRRPFLIWMCLSAMIVCGVLLMIRMVDDWKLSPAASPSSTVPSSASPLYNMERLNMIKGLLYGVVSGTLSAHSLLMAKSAVEIVVRGISDNWKDLLRYQSWIIVSFFLTLAISQLYFLNRGLRLCSTSVLYPLVFSIYNITTIINGLIYFDQTSKLSRGQIGLVFLGTMLVLLGVLGLSWRLSWNSAQNAEIKTENVLLPSTLTATPTRSTHHHLHHHHGGLRVHTRFDQLNNDTPLSPYTQSSREYTSFRNPSAGLPSALTEPLSPFTAAKYSTTPRRIYKSRSLSIEQNEILDQLNSMSETTPLLERDVRDSPSKQYDLV